jgi:hypothetical protein
MKDVSKSLFLFGKEFLLYQNEDLVSIWEYKNIKIVASSQGFFIKPSASDYSVFSCFSGKDIQKSLDSNVTYIILRIYDLYSFKESFRANDKQINPIHNEIANLFPREILAKVLSDFKELISEDQLNKFMILI